MKQLELKHPLAVRWLHWINFPMLALMIWSGLLIYWANDVYQVEISGHEVFRFFPQPFYDALGISSHLARGLSLHFFFMWFFTVNGVLYVAYTLVSGEWRSLVPVAGSFRRAGLVMLHDLHLRKAPPPQGKYNDAQRIAYSGVIVMGFGSVVTGLAIYKPLQAAWLTALLGGYECARIEHFILMIGYVLFFLVHIAQVIRAGWSNFRSMIAGYEVIDAVPASPAPGKTGEGEATR